MPKTVSGPGQPHIVFAGRETVSYASDAKKISRVDDLPRNRDRVQRDCTVLAGKVERLTREVIRIENVIAILKGEVIYNLRGRPETAYSALDPQTQASTVARQEAVLHEARQNLAYYSTLLERCLGGN